MSTDFSKPSNRFTVRSLLGGYIVEDPDGRNASRLIKFRPQAEQMRDRLQRKADDKVKRGPRDCLSCGKTFASDGIHNRLCDSCSRGSAGLGDFYAAPKAKRGRV